MAALQTLGNVTFATCEVVSQNITLKNSTATVSTFSPVLCGLCGLYPTWRPVVVFILVCFILMSVAGNGCLVGTIATRESMQEPGNFFLAAMAVTDVFSSFLFIPSSIHSTTHGTYLSGTACKTQAFLVCVVGSLAHSFLLCLWVCRYIHIVAPMTFEKKLSRSRVALAMAMCVLLAVVPSFVGVIRNGTMKVVTYHGANDMQASPTSIYPCVPDLTEASASSAVCLLMMIISTILAILIYREAQRYKDNLKNVSPSPEANAVPPEALENKFKAAKTLGIILLVYWLTWLPPIAMFFMSNIMSMSTFSTAQDVLHIVLLTNTFSDSLLYAFRYEIYREALLQMFRHYKNAVRETILDYIEIIRE
ncbi:trace amine-associated receptor 9-like [Branchiostoma lanceolatum]|uniref:trace amine-associated receptor 9-like n=1 Tax=Branchiostoma lanceolatum TaxID=7740 RepID=UPI0034548437